MWIKETVIVIAVSLVTGAVLSGLLHYYLIYKEVKDLRSFKAQTQAISQLKIQENKIIEQNNEINKKKSSQNKIVRDNSIIDQFKRLHDANSSISSSMPQLSGDTGKLPGNPTYAELTEWYSELVTECTRTVEACALTTNQLNCVQEIIK